MDLTSQLKTKCQRVNDTLNQLLTEKYLADGNIKEAVKYTLQAPGKRIRAAIVLLACELVKGNINHAADVAAAAVEMVHTYSLVHDDLPAMDNDDLRRGKPTCHKAFDEATAILAGDALLTLAFEILSKEIDDHTLAIKIIQKLAHAAGPCGMIAGQMADLQAEKNKPKEKILEYIHLNKTARMFECAALCGALAADANQNQVDRLGEYGLKLGLGFQIADDILDVCSSSEQLGKTAGKDQKAGKMTYPALMGIEKSKQFERKLIDEAIEALDAFGVKAEPLRKLALTLLERTS